MDAHHPDSFPSVPQHGKVSDHLSHSAGSQHHGGLSHHDSAQLNARKSTQRHEDQAAFHSSHGEHGKAAIHEGMAGLNSMMDRGLSGGDNKKKGMSGSGSGGSPLRIPDALAKWDDVIPFMGACCFAQSVYIKDPDCLTFGNDAQICGFHHRFVGFKPGHNERPMLCFDSQAEWPQFDPSCKMHTQLGCFDFRFSFPFDEEVPFLLTCCFTTFFYKDLFVFEMFQKGSGLARAERVIPEEPSKEKLH